MEASRLTKATTTEKIFRTWCLVYFIRTGSWQKARIFKRISWIVVEVFSEEMSESSMMSMVTSPPLVESFQRNINLERKAWIRTKK